MTPLAVNVTRARGVGDDISRLGSMCGRGQEVASNATCRASKQPRRRRRLFAGPDCANREGLGPARGRVHGWALRARVGIG